MTMKASITFILGQWLTANVSKSHDQVGCVGLEVNVIERGVEKRQIALLLQFGNEKFTQWFDFNRKEDGSVTLNELDREAGHDDSLLSGWSSEASSA